MVEYLASAVGLELNVVLPERNSLYKAVSQQFWGFSGSLVSFFCFSFFQTFDANSVTDLVFTD